ncbi:MAG: serine hydrolase [Alphaproteobacteria bacterium]|nr:serine hydrolase [Alphaproteobacteria bacterium]
MIDMVDAEALDLDPRPLARLVETVETHIADGRYPGAEIAVARHGLLALCRRFGRARIDPPQEVDETTLWLLFSNTKVITAAAVWKLATEGQLRFTDPVAMYLPGFEAHGKGRQSVLELLTHQGGFPNAEMPPETWEDREARRRAVIAFKAEWTPGSRVHYHAEAAHWTAAALVEAVSGQDFRTFIRDEILVPIGLEREVFVGLPDAEHGRAADMHIPAEGGGFAPLTARNTPEIRRAGPPGAGGYATAKGMAAFYQMLVQDGRLEDVQLFPPRLIAYCTRNWTGDRVDERFEMPMHRGIGPHVRGRTQTIRGLGSFGHERVFGHGGVGSSYCWADPSSGVSFAYLTNCLYPEPWHSERLDVISNLVHMAILE